MTQSQTGRKSMRQQVKKKPATDQEIVQIRLRYLTSSVDLRGCPQDQRPEIALIGRSNAGKSSLINGLAGGRLAKVSATPGKTRLLNFFDAGPSYRYVDMPGYGFASRSEGERVSWGKMIEPYLATRSNLAGLLILLDVRRDWGESEAMILRWLQPRELPAAVVLTKIDKVSRSEFLQKKKRIAEESGLDAIFGTSALKKTGFAELEDFVFKNWVKPRLRK
jgi:GTP-binding protein